MKPRVAPNLSPLYQAFCWDLLGKSRFLVGKNQWQTPQPSAISYLHHGSSISRLQATCHCAVASVASRKLCKATWSKRSWVEPGITVVSGPGPLEPKGKHREFPWISRVSWKVWWEIYGWNLGFSMVCTIKYGGFHWKRHQQLAFSWYS